MVYRTTNSGTKVPRALMILLGSIAIQGFFIQFGGSRKYPLKLQRFQERISQPFMNVFMSVERRNTAVQIKFQFY